MSAIFGIIGLLGFGITFIIFVVKIIKKQPKKNVLLALFVFLILFFIGLLIPSNNTKKTEEPVLTETITANDLLGSTETFITTEASISTATLVPTYTFTPTHTSIPTDTSTPTYTPIPTETPLTFILFDSEIGDYGKEITLNAGTEFEEKEIAYYIPAGTYLVTNLNNKGSEQVSVYSGGPEYDGEWQYFTSDENCARPIVVMAKDTKELEIKEGQFIVLSDGADNLQFILK